MFRVFFKNNNDFEIFLLKMTRKKFLPKQKNLKIFSSSRIFNLLDFCNDLNPNLIVISGRMYKNYLKVARFYKGKVKIVTVEDTIFKYSLRGLLKFYFKGLFTIDILIISGEWFLQTAFALSIGFKIENIFENFYVSNFENNQVKSFNSQKRQNY